MMGWVIEAARRGIWKADEALLNSLKDKYINLVNKYGVSCCHHTCANMDFNNYMIVGSSLSSAQIQQFANILEGATGISIDVQGSPGQTTDPNQGSQSTQGSTTQAAPGEASTANAVSGAGQSSDSNSQNAHEITEVSNQSSGQSNMPVVAILGVILLICLVGVGYFRASIVDFLKK
jgi:cobaltochelatase CobN